VVHVDQGVVVAVQRRARLRMWGALLVIDALIGAITRGAPSSVRGTRCSREAGGAWSASARALSR
jgi:hypothetical protein